MYLKRLWLHNKALCWLVILFAAFQLINNIRQDVAFSPVYTYGMYSQVIKPQKKYVIPEITVNGVLLQTKNFTPQQWDKILQPVLFFSKQETWNRLQFNKYIHRLLHIEDSALYLNHMSQAQFNEWYRSYISYILKTDISTLSIQFNEYDLSSGQPVKLPSGQTITVP